MREYCECEKPEPWEDVKGNQTNVCKNCQGVVSTATEIGRLIIQTEGAIRNLDTYDEEERERFTKYLADSANERIRQQFLTWRAGRAERISKSEKAPT